MRWGFFCVALCPLVLAACYREPPGQWEGNDKVTVDQPTTQRDASTQSTPEKVDQTAPAAGDVVGGREVRLGAMSLAAPESWVRNPASSGFVMTEFTLPGAEGDDQDGRLTVSTAGGSIEANIDRWKGQFVPEPTAASQETLQVGDVSVTLVDLAGTYKDQRGPFAPATERENYRMLAAIIPSGGEQYFVKAYGPAKTMAEHEQQFRDFVNSLAPPDTPDEPAPTEGAKES